MNDPAHTPGMTSPAPLAKSGIWKWLLIGGVLACCCSCGVCGLAGFGVYGGFSFAKETVPYQQALNATKRHPAVIEELGEPLVDGLIPAKFDFHVDLNGGHGHFEFTVTGPRGTAQVESKSVREDGKWRLTKLEATFPNGITLDLLDDATESAEPARTP